MTSVTPELIKSLREKTGVGIGKCKEALEETKGDVEKAIEHLRKAGIASAVKKESRTTNEGKIDWCETPEGIAVLEMQAETDFVVNNERFTALQKLLVKELSHHHVGDLESFLAHKIAGSDKTVDELRKELISVLGENIVVSRILFLPKKAELCFGVYSHMAGKILSVVQIEGAEGEEKFAREIGMHIASECPEYLKAEDVPAEIIEREKEIGASQIQGNKPQDILDKILQGKVNAFFDQFCLLNQKYIKDNAITVAQLVANRSKEIGKELKLTRFIRWHVGG
jgi:elongation factor Ts